MDEDLTTHLDLAGSGGRIMTASIGCGEEPAKLRAPGSVPTVNQMGKPTVPALSEVEMLSAMLVEVNA